MRIAFGVLNWGLGHATRSECLIRRWIEAGHEVLVWSDGAALDYLRAAFPAIEFVESPLPSIHYRRRPLWFGLMLQAPRMLLETRREQKRFARFCRDRSIDIAVSDNRPGLGYSGVPSAYISHQLEIPVPGFFGHLVNRTHRRAMRGFACVAIPDAPAVEERGMLSGALSSPVHPISSRWMWLGHLSRFSQREPDRPSTGRNGAILIVLSGPEPMRSQWEGILVEQMQDLDTHRFRLVRGCPGRPDYGAHIEVYERLNASELGVLLDTSTCLICRSGYSSLLDALWTGIPLHCIPTPGQAEQEYLALHLNGKCGIPWSRQSEFDLRKTLESKNWKALDRERALPPDAERLLLCALQGEGKG